MEANNIYLGDAYKLIKELADNSIDLIVTDPPYDIKGIHGAGIMKTRKRGNFTRDIEENGLDKGIDLSILDEFVRVMKKINCYIFCNKEQIPAYLKFFLDKHKCNWEMIILAKKNPIPFCGTHYLVDKEYCLYFWEEGATVNIPFERGKTVYLYNTNVSDKKDYGHPTIKPLEMVENLIANSSGGGYIILDPFLGSGTTALAAKHLGRKYIGFEISEKYYKIAVNRLNGFNIRGEMNLLDI